MKCSVLGEAQIQRIHEGSLEILRRIGIHLPHAGALELFRAAGAEVDAEAQRVRIPEALVERALRECGKTFTLYGRDRSRPARYGQGTRNYNSTAGEALWIDPHTRERRYPSLADVKTAARLGDGLPGINVVGAMADPHELPPEYRCVFVAAELLKNTTKPIHFWFHDRASARFVLDLYALVAGSEAEAAAHPFGYPFLEPISPLRFPTVGVELLFETARFKLPVPIGPMAQTGATAPGTLAGTMAQENAEILAGICMTQLIAPGTPVCYGGIPHVFGMSTMQIVFGGPEQALMGVGLTQMAKHYGLPCYINVGLTDSKTVDAQAGLETGVTLACGAMAGADIFGHLGICGADQGAYLPLLVLQHEVIGYVERLVAGIEVSDEKLGLDSIEDGIREGTFLTQPHTAAHFREELWFPSLLDRQYFGPWSESGRSEMADRCLETMDRVLREHEPEPLADDMAREVDKLLADAKRHLGGQ